MKHIVRAKPLSTNQCWKGRRFKTQEYTAYEKTLFFLLPRNVEIPEGPLTLEIEVGYSNRNSDTGNVEKPFTDILQKRYGFNDNRIFRIVMEKRIVPKGEEYIAWEILPYSQA